MLGGGQKEEVDGENAEGEPDNLETSLQDEGTTDEVKDKDDSQLKLKEREG